MMGTGAFARPTFEAILAGSHPVVGLVTQPDRVVGEKRGSTRHAVGGLAAIARERGIPVVQPEKINTPEGIATLKELKPDLLVVAAYGQILSCDVLAVPAQGGINVHASLLPKYRGAAPVAWAIYHGETESGVTIIKMSVRLDAGDMLAQETLAIRPTETAGELESRLAPLGARLAAEVIEQIAAGRERGTKQNAELVTKAPKLTKDHGLINWSGSAREVVNQIRAMQPWPTAYTFYHHPGQEPLRLIVHRALASERAHPDRLGASRVIPGEPLRLIIEAGQGTHVEILDLQPAGKRRMSAAEFLRGHRVVEGDSFGPEVQ